MELTAANRTLTFIHGKTLEEGRVIGDIDEAAIRRIQIREQIRETTRSHVERERQLHSKGIKIDVRQYRLAGRKKMPRPAITKSQENGFRPFAILSATVTRASASPSSWCTSLRCAQCFVGADGAVPAAQ